MTIDLATEVTPGEEGLGISLPHTVLVDDQVVDLGRYELWLENPTLVDRRESPEGMAHTFTTADRSFIWRRHDPTGTSLACRCTRSPRPSQRDWHPSIGKSVRCSDT